MPASNALPALPPKVRALEAKDICRAELNGPHGTHCLIGWIGVNFGPLMKKENYAADAAYRAISQAISPSGYALLAAYTMVSDEADVAVVFNAGMARLGYIRRGRWFHLSKASNR